MGAGAAAVRTGGGWGGGGAARERGGRLLLDCQSGPLTQRCERNAVGHSSGRRHVGTVSHRPSPVAADGRAAHAVAPRSPSTLANLTTPPLSAPPLTSDGREG
ncbi:hypothetical protein Stsp01_39430 [Streptomyces sp. NBRC 13847]|nr:hypothetical protein Stsp01_39430 [Streptomyces sp. NBRC 13847]